jgi:hypothetical protein
MVVFLEKTEHLQFFRLMDWENIAPVEDSHGLLDLIRTLRRLFKYTANSERYFYANCCISLSNS